MTVSPTARLEGPAQRGHHINPLRNIQDLGCNFTDPRSKATLRGQPVYAAFFAGAPAGFDGKPFAGQGCAREHAVVGGCYPEPLWLAGVILSRPPFVPGTPTGPRAGRRRGTSRSRCTPSWATRRSPSRGVATAALTTAMPSGVSWDTYSPLQPPINLSKQPSHCTTTGGTSRTKSVSTARWRRFTSATASTSAAARA